MMKKILSVIIAAALVLSFGIFASADFGDFGGGSDFSFDYDTDWGGGFDDWDTGSGDFGDDIWDGGYNSGINFGPGFYVSGGSSFDIIIVAAVILIAVCLIAAKKSGKNIGGNKQVNLGRAPDQNLENHIDELKAKDPAFSEERFMEDVSNLYVRLQNAWTAKDLSSVQTRIASELYAKSQAQLNAMKEKGVTNYVDNISVMSTDILGCTLGEKEENIVLKLVARITDYTVEDSTGKILSGFKDKQVFMTYHLTMTRTAGVKTEEEGNLEKSVCPNCGAPVDLNQHAICQYCGSVLESGKHTWVLSNMKATAKQTV